MFIPSAFKELTNCVSTDIGNKTPRAEVLPSVTPPGIGQLLLFIAVLGFPLAHAQEGKSTAMADGERIFQQCSGCHAAKATEGKAGPSLKGLFKRRNLLNGAPATEPNIRSRIKHGGDGIPSYEQVLSAKELDQVIAYLKKL